MTGTTTVTTPIERIALSMLDKAEAWQPELRAWVEQIRDNADAAHPLGGELGTAIIEHRAGLIPERHDSRPNRMRHEATYRLASAIVAYRSQGRPSDVQRDDRVVLGTLDPDLSAVIVAYHEHLLNAYAVECQSLEDALEDAR